jgi:hypothetical protein
MRRLSCCLFLAVILAACSVPTPLPQSPLETPVVSKPYSPIPTTVSIVTPSKSDRATITGVLMESRDSPRPAAGLVLYLAQTLQSSGAPTMASLDRASSPRAQTDSSGRFVFAEVPIAKYGLVFDRIDSAYLLHNPKDDGDFLFEPKAGQVLDLGTLVYSSLP